MHVAGWCGVSVPVPGWAVVCHGIRDSVRWLVLC